MISAPLNSFGVTQYDVVVVIHIMHCGWAGWGGGKKKRSWCRQKGRDTDWTCFPSRGDDIKFPWCTDVYLEPDQFVWDTHTHTHTHAQTHTDRQNLNPILLWLLLMVITSAKKVIFSSVYIFWLIVCLVVSRITQKKKKKPPELVSMSLEWKMVLGPE